MPVWIFRPDLMRGELIAEKPGIIKALIVIKLQGFADELGYPWADLQGAGLIDDGELAYAVQNWSMQTDVEWRAYVDSIGTRTRHNCRGLALITLSPAQPCYFWK